MLYFPVSLGACEELSPTREQATPDKVSYPCSSVPSDKTWLEFAAFSMGPAFPVNDNDTKPPSAPAYHSSAPCAVTLSTQRQGPSVTSDRVRTALGSSGTSHFVGHPPRNLWQAQESCSFSMRNRVALLLH